MEVLLSFLSGFFSSIGDIIAKKISKLFLKKTKILPISFGGRKTKTWEEMNAIRYKLNSLNFMKNSKIEIIKLVTKKDIPNFVEVSNLFTPLTEEEERKSRSISGNLPVDDPIYIFKFDKIDWNTYTFDVQKVKYSIFLILRDHRRLKNIYSISGNQLVTCPENKELILQRRGENKENTSFPNKIHTFGGLHKPSYEHYGTCDEKNIFTTILRETEEEGLKSNFSIEESLVFSYIKEEIPQYIQFTAIGSSINRDYKINDDNKGEGIPCKISYNWLEKKLEDTDSFVPSGLVHNLIWLFFQNPKEKIFNEKTGYELFNHIFSLLEKIPLKSSKKN